VARLAAGSAASTLLASQRVANGHFKAATGWAPAHRDARTGWASVAEARAAGVVA
jgi:hypothetical protein